MIKLGIIGAGPNGAGHARRFAELHDRCRVVFVADLDLARAAQVAGDCGARAVAQFTEALDTVDAVVISSPNFLHVEHALAAVQAGKHVWIEKPMALTTADADRIVHAVEQARVVSFVGFSVRFDPSVRALLEKYRTGELGPLLSIWSRRMGWSEPGGGWRAEFAKSGGLMHELLTHEIDWIVSVDGQPTAVFCRKASRQEDHPHANDHVWLTLSFGKATGTIEGSQMSVLPVYERGILGETGAVFTTDWGRAAMWQKAPKESVPLPLPVRFDKYAHFLDAIEGRVASVADAQWGRGIVRIAEAGLQSAVSGQPVAL